MFLSISKKEPFEIKLTPLNKKFLEHPISSKTDIQISQNNKIIICHTDQNDRYFFILLSNFKNFLLVSKEKYLSIKEKNLKNYSNYHKERKESNIFSNELEINLFINDLIEDDFQPLMDKACHMIQLTIHFYSEIYNAFLKLRTFYFHSKEDFNFEIVRYLDYLFQKAVRNIKNMLFCFFSMYNELTFIFSGCQFSIDNIKSKLSLLFNNFDYIEKKYLETFLESEKLLCLIDEDIFCVEKIN